MASKVFLSSLCVALLVVGAFADSDTEYCREQRRECEKNCGDLVMVSHFMQYGAAAWSSKALLCESATNNFVLCGTATLARQLCILHQTRVKPQASVRLRFFESQLCYICLSFPGLGLALCLRILF
jgi:hypothetical protein